MKSQETLTRSGRHNRLAWIVGTTLFTVVLGHLPALLAQADEPADPYDTLYDVIMTRHDKAGKSYAENETSPAIFLFSKFPFDDQTFEKFQAALNTFAALPQSRIEAYSDVQRALLQRHLWKAFDATLKPNFRGYEVRHPDIGTWELHLDRRAAVQPTIALLLKRLALTKEQIQALPDTLAATAKAGRFPQRHDPSDQFKPFFPTDLYAQNSSWVCLREDRHQIPANVHTSERYHRSAFFTFMRHPEGREQTLEYMQHRKDPNEVFPVGTQFALIEQAFLISTDGEVILSPLVVSVQLRAYLNVEQSVYKARPNPTQCVAEFNMQPRELMKGNAVMRALTPEDRRFEAGEEECQLSGGPYDPFENGHMPTARLNLCMRCHGGPPIRSGHSVLTVYFKSKRGAVVEASRPAISKATATRKQEAATWEALMAHWQANTP